MWYLPVVFSVLLTEDSYGAILSFPEGFKFGAATAAYQVEGGWNVSDKGPSIWDTFTHEPDSKISDKATGDVACDSYHLWETDIEIAVNMSLDFYRFSINWPRILPNGLRAHISEDGKNYYNKLIDGLLAKGIEPIVTMYHWELPQRLQDLGGWINPLIADWFADYADVLFSLYGDRVKTWITLNEPVLLCDATYHQTFVMAPGILDSDVAPLLCSKNTLMAHARAYRLYQEKYKQRFKGQVSLVNHMFWFEGMTKDDADLAELVMEYSIGRYAHPIFSKKGGWPPTVEKLISGNSAKEGYLSSRLPAFTEEERKLVLGSADFFAFNHYTSRLVRKALPGETVTGYPLSGAPELNAVFVGKAEWQLSKTSTWLLQNPVGIRNNIAWARSHYGDLPILITENGYSTVGGQLEDHDRVKYYRDYLSQVLLAIHEDGANILGYTAWSLIDNFEWIDGYRSKFGLYEVNFSDPLRTRTPRKSAMFYADVIRRRSLNVEEKIENK